ncbi:AAA family ATPase [Chitinophaga sp. GCM10012297]|uniref:AAA family ATPase n=1 Tax=Chitinophaga chungangae TaxID=2821488 RepID=A0ABS3YB71_9BACT|nr:AAA family ATPase [Chitinophaga chungangae]MBO9151909.1 AAA family ATPase [Chitinophaga chungangae]
MKRIYLQNLTLRNFKGVLDLVVNFSSATRIMGANETGKSTILSAFYWLLTGKDEFDRKDYEIKNTSRPELNAQSHEVEGVFQVGSHTVKLKRAYLEDWKKPKGQSRKVFNGHYTDYFVNDVPCSATEFQSKVDEMIPTHLIKLVTNPMFFNSMKWDDQRRGLIGIAGEISDADIFAQIVTLDNDFSNLKQVIASGRYKNLDEYKKELASKRLLLKKAAEEYAPRIDEAKRNCPEVLNWAGIESQIKDVRSRITAIDDQIADASKAQQEKQKGITELRNQVFSKESAIAAIRNRVKTGLLDKKNDGAGEVSSLLKHIKSIGDDIIRAAEDIKRREQAIENCQKEVARLDALIESNRKSWSEINAEKFQFDESSCSCPTCKQQLPAGQIEKTKADLLKNFNEDVAARKAEEVRKSNQSKAERARQLEAISGLQLSITELEATITGDKARLPDLQLKLEALQQEDKGKSIPDIEAAVDLLMEKNADALNLKDEISELTKQINAATAALGQPSDFEQEKSEKAQLNVEHEALQKSLAIRETIEKTGARISQLEAEESANAQEIANIEQRQFEVESYTRVKMDILEQRVNGMFRYVSFRLFETQVNGAIAETCVCEYKGVPYPTLNTAAKMLAGLDVLETFSNHYGIHAPVFCDNRESVSFIPESKSQLISLFVSPADSTLRVEAA